MHDEYTTTSDPAVGSTRLLGDVLKRCDGCGQIVMVSPKLTQHGRLKRGTTEILRCGNLIAVSPNVAGERPR